MAVETDSLSLILATLRMTDCLGLTTTQILTQEEAQGIVAIDHDRYDFGARPVSSAAGMPSCRPPSSW